MLTKPLSIRRLLAMGAFVLIICTTMAACKKTGIDLPPSQASFLNQLSGVYFITAAGVADTIPIGVTTVADKDRTVSFTVRSPSGAVRGTQPGNQYNLAADSVRIPAGQALGYIVVKGNFGFYNGTPRKDTLVFTFTNNKSGEIAPSDFNDTFTLVMRGPCIEGLDFNPAEFNGIYNNCIDDQPGFFTSRAYSVNISCTSTGPASATLIVQNLGGGAFFPTVTDPAVNPGITVDLDWSNLSILRATVLSQPYKNTRYVTTLVGSPGTFSSCHQIFVLNYDVIITAIGYDSGVFSTTIAR